MNNLKENVFLFCVSSLFKPFLLFAAFMLIVFLGKSQVINEKKIILKAERIYADNFDNFYVLSDNTFSKYNSEGKKLFSFYPEGGDEITSVDVRNSFKILLFFSFQNKIVLLDNKLSEISEDVFLEKFDIYGDAKVCKATNGGFWIYDNVNFQIIKLDSQFKIEYKRNVYFPEEIISMTDNSAFIFFKRKSKKIFLYNYNTGNIFNLEFDNTSENIGLTNNEVVYYNDNLHCLRYYNIKTFEFNDIKLPSDISIINAVAGKSKVFFFDQENVYISSKKINEKTNKQ